MKMIVAGSLALALAANIAVSASAQRRGSHDVPPDQCPAEGTARSQAGKALNTLKNRDTAPRPDQIDRAVTLEAMLPPGDDEDRFDDQKGAVITGWVVDVEQGGHPETANCGSRSLAFTDTHITVGLIEDPTSLTETLVVEVTPRWRQLMQSRGKDWSTEALQAELIGKRVQFTGWLMFDTEHAGQAVNTAPRNRNDWRKTVWEVHPVTAIEVQ